eukprot:2489603-Amphidinium_carterae.1
MLLERIQTGGKSTLLLMTGRLGSLLCCKETVDDTPEPAGGAIPGTNNYGNLEFLPGATT